MQYRNRVLHHKAEMKAQILLGICLFVTPLAPHAQPYAGTDINRYSLTLNNADSELFPQSAGGIDLHLGERFGNLAGEIGYGTSTSYGKTVLDNLHLTRAVVDGFWYLPVFGGLNLLATGGGAQTNYGLSSYALNAYQQDDKNKIANADMPLSHGNEFNWRAGGGFSFGLDEFELRVLARYQPLSMQHQAQSALSLDVGLNMYF